MTLTRYFHTIRFLRPVQLFGRVVFRVNRPRPDFSPAPARRIVQRQWQQPVRRERSQTGAVRFRFLNAERELRESSDWNNPTWPKLWLYNLHYFDDLNARDAVSRSSWHSDLMHKWIDENPPGGGNGWEPYPLSLRVVNWVKWALAGNELTPRAGHSLAVQVRYLARRLEFHLLGNHLIANAKALVFAGAFFQGDEADKWFRTGISILIRELKEQVLTDGGHFERSPMYHNIVLEDVLDLLNLLCAYDRAMSIQQNEDWAARAAAMLRYSQAMAHPDGDIALLNDSAVGIAAPLRHLDLYAKRLGIQGEAPSDSLLHLNPSGYVRGVLGPACAFFDVGTIGPDYLPGHAHADTLSFELSLHGRRVIVDSGTSTYESGAERLRQRSTAAHNTVEIDNENSSEVWGSFRVARRAYPIDLEITRGDDMIHVRCGHDGYRRLKGLPLHHREWILRSSDMVVSDVVQGGFASAVARFHFHPDCVVSGDARAGALEINGNRTLEWHVEHGQPAVVDSSYHPQFGLSVAAQCLEVKLEGGSARTVFSWPV